MKKNLKWVYYRHPRTRQEARANQEGWERARRRPRNLPSSYDDLYPHADSKCWKAKRKTQYHPDGRGKEHSVIVDATFTYEWDLAKYFKEHNIPYCITNIKEPYRFKKTLWKRVKLPRKRPVYQIRHTKKAGQAHIFYNIIRWEDDWTWKEDGYKWIDSFCVIAYKVTWWYNKNVGIDYILKQCRRNPSRCCS